MIISFGIWLNLQTFDETTTEMCAFEIETNETEKPQNNYEIGQYCITNSMWAFNIINLIINFK